MPTSVMWYGFAMTALGLSNLLEDSFGCKWYQEVAILGTLASLGPLWAVRSLWPPSVIAVALGAILSSGILLFFNR